jgi:carboxypeptidase PM20D1
MEARLEGTIRRTFAAVGPEMSFGKRLVFANLWLFGPLVKRRLVESPATNAVLRSTFAPTMLEGSPRENVLAQRARALVNVRIHPRDSIAAVTRHARLVIADPGVRVRALAEGASEPVPPATASAGSDSTPGSTPGYRLVARTIRQVFPDALVAPGLMVGLTDSRHYREVARETLRFAPLRIAAADRARFHGVNERIATRNYLEAITFYAQLIRNASR